MFATEYPLRRASTSVNAWALLPTTDAVQLEASKRRVQDVIALIGRPRWNSFVNAGNERTKLQTDNRACRKLREILQSCVLAPARRSLHLCESPGGFVRATAEHATTRSSSEWEWKAMSIASGPSPATDELPMQSGAFLIGDVFDDEWCDTHLPSSWADFVTADGAREMDHDALEREHFPLLLAQSVQAFRALAPGGVLVIKFFEGNTTETMQWIAWMTHAFQSCSVIKPTSSRSTNSERYLVGRHFLHAPKDMVSELQPALGWQEETQRVLDALNRSQNGALQELFARIEGRVAR